MNELTVPYFVYGTLRPEGGNDDTWWRHRATVKFDGFCIAHDYGLVGRGIPFAVRRKLLVAYRGEAGPAIGTLIVPPEDPDAQQGLRWDLDQLEGHPHCYVRTPTFVATPDGNVLAWIYVMVSLDWMGERYAVIENGDYMSEVCSRGAAWR